MSPDTIQWVNTALSLLSLLVTIGLFIYVQVANRNRATVQSITKLGNSVNERFRDEARRISDLEAQVNRLPSREEINHDRDRTSEEITRIHERVDEINEGIKQMQLILGQLLGQAKIHHGD